VTNYIYNSDIHKDRMRKSHIRSQNINWPGRNMNLRSPECKSRALHEMIYRHAVLYSRTSNYSNSSWQKNLSLRLNLRQSNAFKLHSHEHSQYLHIAM